jgi:Ribonuclease G/E
MSVADKIGRVLHVADCPGERRFALAEGDRLLHLEIARPHRPDRVEEVCRARVETLAASQNGAFLRLPPSAPGMGDTVAFLPSNAAPKGVRLVQGQLLCVQVTRAAMAGKGLRVGTKGVAQTHGPAPALLAPALLTPAPDPEARLVRDFAPDRINRADAFPPAIEDAVAALSEADQPLPEGGRLRVCPTPAATLIDIDAGAADPATANARAVQAVAEAIVLRNLSGVILVDFAALASRTAKTAMVAGLRAALGIDPLRAEVTGHSPAGLVEVVRTRIRPPLHEVLGSAHAAWAPSVETLALAALRQARHEALANPALRPALRAHPDVMAALERMPDALAAFAARCGAALRLRPDAGLPAGTWALEDARHG